MEKVYSCKECNKTFPKYYDLRRHNKLHTGEHPFMCEICGLGFTDNNRLIIHVSREHTGRKPFECSVCDKAFCRSSDLNRHVKIHEKDRHYLDSQILDQTLECTISEKDNALDSGIGDSPFQNHSLSEESSEDRRDSICLDNSLSHFILPREASFFSGDRRDIACSDLEQSCEIKPQEIFGNSSEGGAVFIDDHILSMAASHSDKSIGEATDLKLHFPIEASYLDEKIFDLADFNKGGLNSAESKPTSVVVQNTNRRPMANNEGEKKLVLYTGERPLLGRPFECKYCEKSFTKSSDLKRHLMIHTGDRPFVCNLCGTGFIEKSKLIVHTRHHTGERPFECQECGKTFIKKSDMTNHRKTHSGERNFVCCECGKAFMKKSDLTRHTRLHTGERPYVCVVCGAAFTESGKLRKHTVVHTGEKNMQCDTCGKRFAKNSDLRRHTRIHTGERPYLCHLCSKTFTYSQVLKDHLKKEHNYVSVPANQSIQDTQFANVVETINSSIVTPALAFLVNQNQKSDEQQPHQQQFDAQAGKNPDNHVSGTSDPMKIEAQNKHTESEEAPKWNEDPPGNPGYSYSRVDSAMLGVQASTAFSQSNLVIKEEMMSVEETN